MATPVANSIPLDGGPLGPFVNPLEQGSSWQFGGSHVLTYSLSLNANPNGTRDFAGGAWTPTLSNAVATALAAWSSVANITFVESGSGGLFPQSTADIAFTLTGNELQSELQAASLGIFPDPNFANLIIPGAGFSRATYPHPEGDVFLDNSYSAFNNTSPGGLGLQLIIHEIGHALGLKHPFDDGGNGRPTFAQEGLGVLDQVAYTLMSYSNISNVFTSNAAATPMLLDILAIQSIYGANMAYHTGNDTYALQTYDNAIWDAGGSDTLDASGHFENVTLDLRPGYFSYSTFNNTIVTGIAFGVTIENAVGGSGNDTITGNDANNTLNGGPGNDQMAGGYGDDTYIIDSASDTVIENPGQGIDTVLSPVTYTLPANVENLTLTGSAPINGTGNALDNVIIGNSGANTLNGGAGNDLLNGGAGVDTMSGGPGNDTYVVDDVVGASGPTTLNMQSQPGDWVGAGQTYAFTPGSGTFTTSAFDQNADGQVDYVHVNYFESGFANNFDLSFAAEPGSNLLPGTYLNAERFASAGHPGLEVTGNGRGSSFIFGNFTIVAATYDFVTVPGSPIVQSLSINFEQHSELPSAPALTGTVNINYTPGILGTPELVIELPNEGNDTVLSSIPYTLPINVENLTLTGTSDINGTGNGLDNVLTGNSGVNVLTGGAGNDTYVVQNPGDSVVENPGEGIDTLSTPFSTGLPANVENITLTGSANVDATGNGLDNVLAGNAGINVLTGGAGNDTYVIQNTGDSVVENPGDGTDTVMSSVSCTLPANVENLTLTGTGGINGTGNGLDNVITGNGSNNTLTGLGGNDTLNGGAGFDTAVFGGNKSSYTVVNASGHITVTGPDGNDTLTGIEKLHFDDGDTLFALLKHLSGADLTGDGRADLLAQNQVTGQFASFSLTGSSVTGGTPYPYAVPADWTVAGLGDVSGDGQADIVWRTGSSNQVAEWTLSGGAVVGGAVYPYVIPADWTVAGMGDINGDAKADIIWQTGSSNMVAAWTLNGGTVTGGVVFPYVVPADWTVAGVADIGGDGKSDIVWRTGSSNMVAEWTLNGLTVTGGAVYPYVVPADWSIAGVKDINGDAKADIVWQTGSSNQVAEWTLNGGTVTGGAVYPYIVPAGLSIAGVGDLNGDHKADILWHNDTTGLVAEWTLDGATVTGGAVMGNTTPGDWVIL